MVINIIYNNCFSNGSIVDFGFIVNNYEGIIFVIFYFNGQVCGEELDQLIDLILDFIFDLMFDLIFDLSFDLILVDGVWGFNNSKLVFNFLMVKSIYIVEVMILNKF